MLFAGPRLPRSRIRELIEYYTNEKVGFADMLTEELADCNHELRWAVTPSVVQYIGVKSSKGGDFGDVDKYNKTMAEKIWNFAFEDNDDDSL